MERSDEAQLIAWLDERDVACPVCEYNLRNLASAVCPECQAPLRLGVSSPNLNVAPWFVAMTSIALGAGFDGVVTVLIAASLAIFQGPPTPAALVRVIIVNLSFLILSGLCVTGLIAGYRSRRRWAFWPRHRQWGTAAAIFLVTFVGHGMFGLLIAWWFS